MLKLVSFRYFLRQIIVSNQRETSFLSLRKSFSYRLVSSFFISQWNLLMLVLIELRCEWNSSTCSLFTHTWLLSKYLNHHLGGFGADKRAFSSRAFSSSTRQDDGSITVYVFYRKATHSDRYLDFNHTTVSSINTRSYAPSWIAQRIFHPLRRKHYEKLSE